MKHLSPFAPSREAAVSAQVRSRCSKPRWLAVTSAIVLGGCTAALAGCTAAPPSDEAVDDLRIDGGVKLSNDDGLTFSASLYPNAGRFSRTYPVRLELTKAGKTVLLGCEMNASVDSISSHLTKRLHLGCTDPDDADLVDVLTVDFVKSDEKGYSGRYTEMSGDQFFKGKKEDPTAYFTYPLTVTERSNDPTSDLLALGDHLFESLVSVVEMRTGALTPKPGAYRADALFASAEEGERRALFAFTGMAEANVNFSRDAKITPSISVLKDPKSTEAGLRDPKELATAYEALLR